MRLPKNIATMTDVERGNWWRGLSDFERDAFRGRMFVSREWAVYVDDELYDCFSKRALALACARRLISRGFELVVIERWSNRCRVYDGVLVDRDFD